MKKISFCFGLLLCVFLTSCFGDDDDGQPDSQSVDLIGVWELEEISNTEIFSMLGCTETNPTRIEFMENDEVVLNSFQVAFLNNGTCRGNLENSMCQFNLNGTEELQGNYTINSSFGMVLFNDASDEIDETDDFIPPPMNVFNYILQGNFLTLTTANSCVDPPIVYTFEKN